MIRDFKAADTDAVMRIWLTEITRAHGFVNAAYWQKQYNTVRDEYLQTCETFVYQQKGQVQAFLSLYPEHTVGMLFVAKPFWRKGIGTELVSRAKQVHRTLDAAVYTKNLTAIAFFTKQRFTYSHTQTDVNTDETERVYIYNGGELQ